VTALDDLQPVYIDGWPYYHAKDVYDAVEELRAEVARLKWIIDAKSTQNQGFSGSFSPDSKCDYARGPSGQREE